MFRRFGMLHATSEEDREAYYEDLRARHKREYKGVENPPELVLPEVRLVNFYTVEYTVTPSNGGEPVTTSLTYKNEDRFNRHERRRLMKLSRGSMEMHGVQKTNAESRTKHMRTRRERLQERSNQRKGHRANR